MREGVMAMFTFSIVRKIGEGNYLNEDTFILERVRRRRALNESMQKIKTKSGKARPTKRDELFGPA